MGDNTTQEKERGTLRVPPTIYKVCDVSRAHRRCAELAEQHPDWPQARVRKAVAGELGVTTTGLRYLLRK